MVLVFPVVMKFARRFTCLNNVLSIGLSNIISEKLTFVTITESEQYLNPASAARASRLGAVEETPQEVRQNDENQSVQQQTAQLGNTLACGDPAAEQLAGEVKRHGAGDGNERGKRDDFLDGIHLIRVYKLIDASKTPIAVLYDGFVNLIFIIFSPL